MTRWWLVVVLATAAGALPTTSFGQPPAQVTPRPLWAVDDTWTYIGPGGASFTFTVREVAADHYTLEDHSGPNVSTFQVGFDFSPSWFARFQWPLQMNERWSFDTEGPAGNDASGTNKFTTTSVVDAYEAVTVPAGTFDAYRIKGSQCNQTQQGRCGEFLVWYAPRVKSYVKISWVTTDYWGATAGKSSELLSFQVH
ncbi:MAG TPA: hypothetical protein VJT32_13980 [bacterium]|nr:hypothetical protein [bacterium]